MREVCARVLIDLHRTKIDVSCLNETETSYRLAIEGLSIHQHRVGVIWNTRVRVDSTAIARRTLIYVRGNLVGIRVVWRRPHVAQRSQARDVFPNLPTHPIRARLVVGTATFTIYTV